MTIDKDVSENEFVVFHVGRCGSTVLTRLLNKQEGVSCDGEIFELQYARFVDDHGPIEPIDYLKNRAAVSRQKFRVHGCELKLVRGTHFEKMGLRPEEAPDLLAQNGFRNFVLLHRKNLLDRIVSQLVAEQRKSYVLREGETASIPRINVPVSKIRVGKYVYTLLEAIQSIEQEVNLMRDTLVKGDHRFVELIYEDHIQADPNVAVNKLSDFLGFDHCMMNADLKKIVTKRKSEIIENYDDVENALRDTQYAWMLD